MHGKTFHWCATCKRWTTSHNTSEHKSNTAGSSTNTPSNVSLMATSTNFAAWHVSIDHKRQDLQEKENYWLDLINTFISNFIFLPIQLVLWFVIGIGLSTILLLTSLQITAFLGYGIIAPLVWIFSMIVFGSLQPILSFVAPTEPPPPLPRWKKRKIRWWMDKYVKKELSTCSQTATLNIDSFHRSYPLRLRSNGVYHLRDELIMREDENRRHSNMLQNVQIMEDRMEKLFKDNAKLISANKFLIAQREASKLYNPTPFERENTTPEEKAEQIQKALATIKNEFDVIRRGIFSINELTANIAQFIIPPRRTFLNLIRGYVPTSFQSTASEPHSTNLKTIIWDSGSSMCITNDRSEFIKGEYEGVPEKRTITGISDTKVMIEGVGMVSWSIEDTNGTLRTLQLPCLYVPSIQQRLLSTSALLKQYPNEKIDRKSVV